MLDNFKLMKTLGEGCSAQVREAQRRSDKKKVALKIFMGQQASIQTELL